MNVDAEILSALRLAGTGAVSGAELSQKLGISRAANWARIEDLRALGYEIEATPHQEYRLLATPDLLHADDLVSRLGQTEIMGRDIQVFQQTTSTNDVVDKLARDGAKEGVVVFAETQTKGRGRLGRRWTSPSGKGLWFSVLLRPRLRPLQATQLTVVAATAVRRALREHTSLDPEIKWPNDILNPQHPYTQALLRSIPRLGQTVHGRQRLESIQGSVPDPYSIPAGCPFHPRCKRRIRGVCDRETPPWLEVEPAHKVRCVLYAA